METVVSGGKKFGLYSFLSTDGGVIAIVVSEDGRFTTRKLTEIRMCPKPGRKPKLESEDE